MGYSRKNKHSLKRIIDAIKFSLAGFVATSKTQPAFRELLVVFFLGHIVLGFLPVTKMEMLLLSVVLFVPLLTEIINCAIENLADAVELKNNQYIKIAKDCGSAVTFLANIIVMIVWFIVLIV